MIFWSASRWRLSERSRGVLFALPGGLEGPCVPRARHPSLPGLNTRIGQQLEAILVTGRRQVGPFLVALPRLGGWS
jgi:hypothetical protein